MSTQRPLDDDLSLTLPGDNRIFTVRQLRTLGYQDHGLMFAQAWEHVSSKHARLGGALYPQFLNKRLKALCPTAKVRHIKVHGLRHTCATLSLAAGVPRHIVQERLGHGSENTLSIYSHALPSMQEDAGRRIGTQLFG